MNSRLLRYTLHMSMLPLGGILLVFALRNNENALGVVLIGLTMMQMLVILYSKKVMQLFINPDIEVLDEMNVNYVPAAYEPGRFKIDARVASAAMWLTMVPPFLIWLAVKFPREVNVAVMNFACYTAPNMDLLVISVGVFIIGLIAFPFWFETSRAAVIYSEGSDKKRYQLRGFADSLEDNKGIKEYLKACRRHQNIMK